MMIRDYFWLMDTQFARTERSLTAETCVVQSDICVRYDRVRRILTAQSWRDRALVGLMRLVQSAVAPLGYLGITRLHGLIGNLFPKGCITEIMLDNEVVFAYPSNDYYWNRLLVPEWEYEPEVLAVFKALRECRYVFVDLGANLGYWSCMAASPAMGGQQVLAVEPSPDCLEFLTNNLAPYSDMVSILTAAANDVSGQVVKLYGRRHAGYSLRPDWNGPGQPIVAEVETITIDDMLEHTGIDTMNQTVLIKLDIEGLEKKALLGGRRALKGDVAIIMEDVEFGQISDAVHFVRDELGFSMYYPLGDQYLEVESVADLHKLKSQTAGLQAKGLNLIAFQDDRWRQRLQGVIKQASS